MVDVAHTAGVSLKTVSRVINAEAGVRPETAEKVLAAAASLRYERNDIAASLRHGARSFTLGLVIEDVANPFYSAIAQAVEERARERSSMLITASAREDPVRERELVTALLRRRVDALLVVPTGADHRYIHDAGFDTRTVFLDRPPARAKADTVLVENASGARRAVEHLLSGGHTRIAFVGDDVRLFTARERLGGYRKALARAGVAGDPELVAVGNSTSADARRATAAAHGASAGAAADGDPHRQQPVHGRQRCMRSTGGAVPSRSSASMTSSSPISWDVTVIRTDPHRIGQLAAELAFERIDGSDAKPRRLVVPAELVTRGSGEIPA